jgi:hypothetical protein
MLQARGRRRCGNCWAARPQPPPLPQAADTQKPPPRPAAAPAARAPRERELHLPAAGEAGDDHREHLLGEADRRQLRLDLGARHVEAAGVQQRVGEHKVDDVEVRQGGLDVVLHVHGAQLVGGREAVDLAVGDRAHERRLADAVGAAQAVAVAAQQAHRRVVEQDLGTVGQRELAVAQLLALVLVHDAGRGGLALSLLDGARQVGAGHLEGGRVGGRGAGRGREV